MSFDLDINNYKREDLEEIFGLKGQMYNEKNIEIKEIKLRENIFSDPSIHENVRKETMSMD
jgi:hypothetical protein